MSNDKKQGHTPKMKRIGDKVWIAGLVHQTFTVKCPDCLGQKYIRAILPTGEEIDLHCCGCGGHTYDTIPTGVVERSQYSAKAELVAITGIDANSDCVEYKFANRYGVEVFDSKGQAMAHAEVLRRKQEDEDHQRLVWKKENMKRTWAWNRYYHQSGIRKAKCELAYHEAKLSFAKAVAKAEGKF